MHESHGPGKSARGSLLRTGSLLACWLAFTGPIATGGQSLLGEHGVAAGDAAVDVGMTNSLKYEPATVRIRVGQTVRWRNTSDVIHTVTADPELAQRSTSVKLPEGAGTFNSGDMKPGEVFTHRFTVAGEYTYFCIPHELAGMIGRVIVEG